MEIRVAREEENKKVIRFLNKVFRKPFPHLIPSLYGKNKNMMRYHFCLEEEGKLAGAICAYPQDIKVGDVTIKGLGVGMVATDKKMRGKGIMTKMLKHVFECYSECADISYLTGLRVRYEHFGYYPGGINYEFKISEMSAKKWEKGNPYTFVKAKTDEDFKKIELLKKEDNFSVISPLSTEVETLQNWFSKVYLVLKNGETVGFASGKFFGAHTLEFLYLEGGVDEYAQAVCAFRKQTNAKRLLVDVLPTEKVYKKAMSLCSEEYVIKSIYKYKVFSYKRLLSKLIAITLKENPTLSYEGVVDFAGKERLKVVIKDGEYSIVETENEAEVCYDETTAIAWLLGQEEGAIPLVKLSLRHSDFI